MMIKDLIQRAIAEPDCKVVPPLGVPTVADGHKLPGDIIEFYELCGGVELFTNSENPCRIVSPNEFNLANPVIVGDICEDDISADWYIIADYYNGNHLTIDLNPSRLGRCYDSFSETHGLVGETPIIAFSFQELLTRLLDNKGQRFYWLTDSFEPLGDAYD